MLKLEEQVCSLKLAKRLKELNCKQDSLFNWLVPSDISIKTCIWSTNDLENPDVNYNDFDKDCDIYSAFTVAELGEKLPSRANNKNVVFSKIGRKYEIYLHRKDEEIVQKEYFRAKTEANARAKMLIYLKENKIIP